MNGAQDTKHQEHNEILKSDIMNVESVYQLRDAQSGCGHSYIQSGPEYFTQCSHRPSSFPSYPFGARFGQFVHIGSMLKSSLESFDMSLIPFPREVGSGGEHDFAAALSALNPSAERLDKNSDR